MSHIKTWFSCILLLAVTVLPARAATYAFIPNQSTGTDSVTRIDTSGPTETAYDLTNNPDGGPYGVAAYNSGSSVTVLVTLADDGLLAKITNSNIDSQTAPVTVALPTGSQPRGVGMGSDNTYAYVANFGLGTVSKVSVSGTMALVGQPIEVGPEPFDADNEPFAVAVFYDPDTAIRKIYVSHYSSQYISVITDNSGSISVEVVASVGQYDGLRGMAVSPDGSRLYVADYRSGDNGALAVLNTASLGTPAERIETGRGPWGVALGDDGAYAYVANSTDDRTGWGLTVIRASDNQILRSYSVGLNPTGVAAPKNGSYAYVVNRGGNTISRVNAADETVEADIGVELIETPYALGAFIAGTAPQAPTGLAAESDSESEISLSWTNNDANALGTKIERRQEDEDTFEQIGKAGKGVTSFTDDDGLRSETTYYYRVRAYTESADSTYTASVSATTEKSDSFSWCFVGTLMQQR